MRDVLLLRYSTSPQGTQGLVWIRNQQTGLLDYFCCSIELPWYGNIPNYSCIPTGEYVCKWTYSPKYKRMMYILLEDFDHRSGIRIHSANWAGDIRKGYKRDLLGCIALGKGFIGGTGINDQLMLHTSRAVMSEFEEEMGGEDFLLKIEGDFECLEC